MEERREKSIFISSTKPNQSTSSQLRLELLKPYEGKHQWKKVEPFAYVKDHGHQSLHQREEKYHRIIWKMIILIRPLLSFCFGAHNVPTSFVSDWFVSLFLSSQRVLLHCNCFLSFWNSRFLFFAFSYWWVSHHSFIHAIFLFSNIEIIFQWCKSRKKPDENGAKTFHSKNSK